VSKEFFSFFHAGNLSGLAFHHSVRLIQLSSVPLCERLRHVSQEKARFRVLKDFAVIYSCGLRCVWAKIVLIKFFFYNKWALALHSAVFTFESQPKALRNEFKSFLYEQYAFKIDASCIHEWKLQRNFSSWERLSV
jgi:hypothetical protein